MSSGIIIFYTIESYKFNDHFRSRNNKKSTSTVLHSDKSIHSLTQSQFLYDIPIVPLKVMIFIDGTWFYYSFLKGRDECPIRDKFGDKWWANNKLDYSMLTHVIMDNLSKQYNSIHKSRRLLENVRTHIFTSTKASTDSDSARIKMIDEFSKLKYDIHRFETMGTVEKCVDISLAVEMLYMATVPDSYDIAVILSGDKDFIPALQKTRMKGKRVAICSMRNSCNPDLMNPEYNARDFDPIWIEDYLDILIQPTEINSEAEKLILKTIIGSIESSVDNSQGSRDIGRALSKIIIRQDGGGSKSALEYIKTKYNNLNNYFLKNDDCFRLQYYPKQSEYKIFLKSSDIELDKADELEPEPRSDKIYVNVSEKGKKVIL